MTKKIQTKNADRNNPTVVVNIRVSKEFREQLRRYAESRGVTIDAAACGLLSDYIDKRKAAAIA